jgi:hypothetical protein
MMSAVGRSRFAILASELVLLLLGLPLALRIGKAAGPR